MYALGVGASIKEPKDMKFIYEVYNLNSFALDESVVSMGIETHLVQPCLPST